MQLVRGFVGCCQRREGAATFTEVGVEVPVASPGARAEMLNCTQSRGGITLGKPVGCAEPKGRLAPTSDGCSCSVTVSGAPVLTEVLGVQMSPGFSKLSSQRYKRPQLAAFWD